MLTEHSVGFLALFKLVSEDVQDLLLSLSVCLQLTVVQLSVA